MAKEELPTQEVGGVGDGLDKNWSPGEHPDAHEGPPRTAHLVGAAELVDG